MKRDDKALKKYLNNQAVQEYRDQNARISKEAEEAERRSAGAKITELLQKQQAPGIQPSEYHALQREIDRIAGGTKYR